MLVVWDSRLIIPRLGMVVLISKNIFKNTKKHFPIFSKNIFKNIKNIFTNHQMNAQNIEI